jgi:hypothetical protein
MLGAGTTVKAEPLLALFETVTTTFPVVAPVGTYASEEPTYRPRSERDEVEE